MPGHLKDVRTAAGRAPRARGVNGVARWSADAPPLPEPAPPL
jgi:hypothetical protein